MTSESHRGGATKLHSIRVHPLDLQRLQKYRKILNVTAYHVVICYVLDRLEQLDPRLHDYLKQDDVCGLRHPPSHHDARPRITASISHPSSASNHHHGNEASSCPTSKHPPDLHQQVLSEDIKVFKDCHRKKRCRRQVIECSDKTTLSRDLDVTANGAGSSQFPPETHHCLRKKCVSVHTEDGCSNPPQDTSHKRCAPESEVNNSFMDDNAPYRVSSSDVDQRSGSTSDWTDLLWQKRTSIKDYTDWLANEIKQTSGKLRKVGRDVAESHVIGADCVESVNGENTSTVQSTKNILTIDVKQESPPEKNVDTSDSEVPKSGIVNFASSAPDHFDPSHEVKQVHHSCKKSQNTKKLLCPKKMNLRNSTKKLAINEVISDETVGYGVSDAFRDFDGCSDDLEGAELDDGMDEEGEVMEEERSDAGDVAGRDALHSLDIHPSSDAGNPSPKLTESENISTDDTRLPYTSHTKDDKDRIFTTVNISDLESSAIISCIPSEKGKSCSAKTGKSKSDEKTECKVKIRPSQKGLNELSDLKRKRIQIAYNSIPRLCPVCGSMKKNLKRHLLTHTGQKLKCDFCDHESWTETELRIHMKYHDKEQHAKFVCDYCEKRFMTQCQKRYHVDSAHLGIKPFSCDQCDRMFPKKSDLLKHVHDVHLQLRPHACTWPDCPKSFKRASHLEQHLRLHTGEAPYKCTQCGYAAKQPISLTSHMSSKHGITKGPGSSALKRKKMFKSQNEPAPAAAPAPTVSSAGVSCADIQTEGTTMNIHDEVVGIETAASKHVDINNENVILSTTQAVTIPSAISSNALWPELSSQVMHAPVSSSSSSTALSSHLLSTQPNPLLSQHLGPSQFVGGTVPILGHTTENPTASTALYNMMYGIGVPHLCFQDQRSISKQQQQQY